MTCVYTFPNGDVVRGKPALKAYLIENLSDLLPARAAAAGFRRTPVAQATTGRAFPREQVAMVERMANGIAERFENRPKVEFFDSLQDANIPEAVRAEDARQREGGATGDPEGFYLNGTVYVWRGLQKADDVSRVMLHESLGHFGLRGVFGQTLKSELEQIVALRKGDVLAKAKEYGFDTKDPAALLKSAEEVLATMAQTTPNIGFVRRAVAAIRTWLRQNVPGLANLELSDAEIIRDYILPARAFVQQGAQAGRDMAAAAAFSRTDAFKRWFGDSKVVDSDGKPRVMYHGTHRLVLNGYDSKKASSPDAVDDVDSFQVGGSGAIYVAYDPKYAEEYANLQNPQNGGRIYAVFVKAEKPFEYYNDEHLKALRASLESAGLFGKSENSNYVSESEWKALQRGSFSVLERGVVRDAIKASGFDSYFVQEPDTVTDPETGGISPVMSLAVFSPTQIKSATGNNGQYDPNNPDIRFSRSKAPAPTGLTPPEQGILRRIQATLQDNFNRLRQVQDRIEKATGGPVPEYANYYGAETNRPGRIAARKEDFQKDMLAPLMAKLAKTGNTPEQLSELLHAMHAMERNDRVRQINPDMDAGSGMTDAKAVEILNKYQGNQPLFRLADQAREIAKATLELKLAYGLIDIDTFTTLADIYQNYVPLKGDGEYGPKIKRAMGHDERDEKILENLARDYEQAVVVGEKNLARQSLLQMAMENPDPELWTVGIPPKGRKIVKEGGFFVAYKDGTVLGKFKTEAEARRQSELWAEWFAEHFTSYDIGKNQSERVVEYEKQLQDNEVPVYVDGQLVRLQINGDETLAKQLRPLDQGQMNPILEGMRSLNRYLSKIYTGYNPAFIATNLARDIGTGTINILGNEGAGTMVRSWTKYPAAMKALTVFAATGKVPTGEAGKMLQEYRQHGGKTGASWMSDLEQQGKTLQRLYDDAYGASGYLADGRVGKAALVGGRKVVTGMAHVIEIANQATENGLRLALFMAMRDQGKSASEAAQAAKSVTVDFDRRGTMTGPMSAIYLFFNPAVQGAANAIKTLAKGKHKQQAWMALGTLAALGFYVASSGMDDDEDRWLGEDWEVRSKNMMINIGGSRIKVPVSLEFAPFYAVGVALAEAKRGASSKMAAAGRIMSSFIGAYFPLQGIVSAGSDNPGMDAALAVVPTAIKPAVQIAANRSSFGSQIYPESEFTKDRPDNLKMFKGTKGTPYDAAAQAIASAGELTGVGRYENDITKVSPETLKMLWRTYTGGLGQFVTDMAGFANVAVQDPAGVEASDVPIVKNFVKPDDVKPIRGRYYDLIKEAKTAATEFQQAKKAGDDEAMDKFYNNPKKEELLGWDKFIRKTNEAAGALRDEMIDINADKSLSLAQKRARLKELEKEEEELFRDAIKAFR